MMANHTEAIEADLQATYQVDACSFWTGGLSLRRLSLLINNLPPDSRLVRALAGPAADWSVSDHMLATLIDLSVEHNWQYASAHRGEGAKDMPHPPRIPRPGDVEEIEEKHFASAEEIQMFLSLLKVG